MASTSYFVPLTRRPNRGRTRHDLLEQLLRFLVVKRQRFTWLPLVPPSKGLLYLIPGG